MIQTVSGKTIDLSAELDQAVAQYRHRIFIERLGWSLPVQNGVERDQFDRPDTVYVVSHDRNGAICGCARLLPTTKPYLLSKIFPQLMGGLPSPATDDVWELSRFAAVALAAGNRINAASNTKGLLAAVVSSAAKRGARRLITVSPLGVERLLYRMGVHAHRAGPPSIIDGKAIFACWIEIDDRTISALGISPLETESNLH